MVVLLSCGEEVASFEGSWEGGERERRWGGRRGGWVNEKW